MSRDVAGPRGATVARLTPDQKVACSNHVGVRTLLKADGCHYINKLELCVAHTLLKAKDKLIHVINRGRVTQKNKTVYYCMYSKGATESV